MDLSDLTNSEEIDPIISPTESDEELEELTAAQVLTIIEKSWLNEKFAPEILPHKSDMVDCLLGQITYMEENLENLNNTDFKKTLHMLELDRLRFVITSYLRTRLVKIETYVYEILKQEQQREERNEELYLTENELQFAKDYKESIEGHFENVLRFWPGMAPDDWKKDPVVPNVHSFVFLKSLTDVDGVMIDDGNDDESDIVDLKSGSQMIISYDSVSQLLKQGKVQLT